MSIASLLDLRGLPVCIMITVVSAALLLFGAVRLPRHPARTGHVRTRHVLVQLVTMLLVAALMLITVAVWINRTFAMYPSWSDLFLGAGNVSTAESIGADGQEAAPLTAKEAAALEAAQKAPVPAALQNPLADTTLTGIKDTDRGQWAHVNIPANASDVTSDALVYLPAGYLQHPDQRYPVIMALSGIPGSPDAFKSSFDLGGLIEQRVASGAMKPSIVIAPRVYPGHYDTECVDQTTMAGHRQGHLWETWLAKDVVGYATSHLRTVQDPSAWTTYGYSAGGWCASMLSVRHPDLFRTSISLAGYFRPEYAEHQVWTAPDDPRYDVPAIVRTKKPAVTMYFFAGADDPLPGPTLAEMKRAVAASPGGPTVLTVQMTPRGGHAMALWMSHAGTTIDWLCENIPAFRGA